MPIYPYAARLQGSPRKVWENEQRVKKNKSLQYWTFFSIYKVLYSGLAGMFLQKENKGGGVQKSKGGISSVVSDGFFNRMKGTFT